MLAESLLGMAIVCLITLVLIPSLFQMNHKLTETKKEVEMWRFMYDTVTERKATEATRETDGWLLKAYLNRDNQSIYIQSDAETKRVILKNVLEGNYER